MSYVNWEREGHFPCPHCKKKIRYCEQNTGDYGTSVFIYDKKGGFISIVWDD